jgi:hypothetical protein
MKTALLMIALLSAILLAPGSASAATCSDYSNQAAAQRAADTRDADGDGIYCESLPCPCSTGAGSSPPPAPPPPPPPPAPVKPSCKRSSAVLLLRFSSAKYPTIKAHTLAAIAKGWPRTMVLNRPGAGERRNRLLTDIPTKAGYDRDEYPAAVGRGRANGRQKGLVRGINPIGWLADVAYVPSSENRSHGSTLEAKLRRYCNGVRFQYVFTS